MDNSYMGWTNWETWNLNLWIDNDEGSRHNAVVAASDGLEEFEQWCQFFVWQSLGLDVDTGSSGPATDFINSGLSEVNYRELQEALLEE